MSIKNPSPVLHHQPSAPPPGAFPSGGAPPPLIIGFASIGAFGIAIISMCAWGRYMGRNVVPDSVFGRFDRFVPARFRRRGQGQGQVVHQRGRRRWRLGQQRERERGRTLTGGETGKAKPEIFDAWIERRRRTVDTLKWEEAETLVSEDHHDALYLFFFFNLCAFWLNYWWLLLLFIALLCDAFPAGPVVRAIQNFVSIGRGFF